MATQPAAGARIDVEALTLDELAIALAPAIADAAIFDGWTDTAIAAAAGAEGVDPAVARLAYPGGAMDMIDAWISSVDRTMVERLDAATLAAMPIRRRIGALVGCRIEALTGREEALRRALAVMALPLNASRSARLSWRSADLMWRLAGDRATDYNHYTKRATLAAIYAATLTVFAQDDSEGHVDVHAFFERRLADVMRFEKAKARFLGSGRERFSLTRFLGRLRYPMR